MHYRDQHVDVTLSREGLRRCHADNALLRRAKFRDTSTLWAMALGVVIGWCALMWLSR